MNPKILKWVFFGTLALGAGLIGYSIWKARKDQNQMKDFSDDPTKDLSGNKITKTDDSFPLKLGSEGDRVKIAQKALKVAVTGKFDKATLAALQGYGVNEIDEKTYNFFKKNLGL